jgi:hypothetical protein
MKKSYPIEITEMKVVPITEGEVIKVITSLKSKNSTGYDNISSKIIKCCATEITKPLAYIFNSSLQSGICPERCTHSIVRLIYKKGNRHELKDYRPRPLSIIFSKIMETLTSNRLNQHLMTNSILVPEQFGFRKGISTQQAIFTLTDNILTALNQWEQVRGIFCDL